ncbi:MAG: phosphoenolpyruvate--protein phosphotransferase [Pseudomonadota bacterium]
MSGVDPAGWGGQRRLLKQLKAIMAGPGGAQERLDKIVAAIAAEMVAEVCSAYVMRRDDVLELFATVGLNPDAVHRTKMRVGEGLVGEIARHRAPLALADARSHPSFAYRPETGEDAVRSLLGAPLLRGDKVIGVLIVQNRTPRRYGDDEIEALETIAMVVAELAASSELLRDATEAADAGAPMRRVGVKLHGGFAIGRARLLRPRALVRRMVSEDYAGEAARLETALAAMRGDIGKLVADIDAEMAETADVMAAFQMFADDKGWRKRIDAALRTGLTAEAAVERVRRDTEHRMRGAADPYIRDRLSDLEDLASRLLRYLVEDERADDPPIQAGDDAILIARTLGPAELLEQDRQGIRAILLEESGPAAHVALIARALDIPTIGSMGPLLDDIRAEDPIIVDADRAQAMVRPTEQGWRAAAESAAQQAALGDAPADDEPTLSRDGRRVEILLNAGLRADFQMVRRTGAEGVGLFRTEIAFMTRDSFPDRASQARIYANGYEAVGDGPLVFRALDVGGDKPLPYWMADTGENPAMGWRATRILLDRPSILRGQIRAMIDAAAGRPLRVMMPMVATAAEFREARRVIEMERDHAVAYGAPAPEMLEIGAMIEVPSAVFDLPALADAADFLALGTNDLCQFLFAVDRAAPHLVDRYDPLSPAFLALIRQVVSVCGTAETPLSVCGEMAGRPLDAMALIGLGVRRLSMSPTAVAPIRAMVRSLAIEPLVGFMEDLVERRDARLRQALRDYARDRGVLT